MPRLCFLRRMNLTFITLILHYYIFLNIQILAQSINTIDVETEGTDVCNESISNSIINACQNASIINIAESPDINYQFQQFNCSNSSLIRIFNKCGEKHFKFDEEAMYDLPECPSMAILSEIESDSCLKFYSIKDCPFLSNFSIQPFVTVDNDKNVIRLNFSWISNSVYVNDNVTKTITINSFEHNSSTILEEPLNDSPSYLILPYLGFPISHFRFSRTYQMNIERDEENCVLNYTIPECIEEVCDCEKLKDNLEITDVNLIEDNTFLVRWAHFGDSYVINYVTYRYMEKEDYYLDSLRIPSVIDENIAEMWSRLEFSNINKKKEYILQAQFHNEIHCHLQKEFEFNYPQRGNKLVIIAGIGVFVLIIGFKRQTLAKYIHKKVKQIRGRFFTNDLSNTVSFNAGNIAMEPNPQYTPFEILTGTCNKLEIPRHCIVLKKEIGSGAFGKVYLAAVDELSRHKFVAVKTLPYNASKEEMADLLAEIEIFRKIGEHPNIVELVGFCTLDPPYMMVMEYVPCGDLKNYLVDLRAEWKNKRSRNIFFPDDSDGMYIVPTVPDKSPSATSVTTSHLPSPTETVSTIVEDYTPLIQEKNYLRKILDPKELQNFAWQIASGMAHLEKIPVTHRDLAARNILINEHKVLKISDFGMSRSGPYINQKPKKLPIRWMAIEAIIKQIYDSKSDVWSFGIVLWEIGTLGAFPYNKVMDSFLIQYLQMGKRLDRPEVCTDQLYDIMQRCWATKPEDRPSFAELVDLLDVKKQRVYVDFGQLNPLYVFPPVDLVNQ